MNYLQTNLFDEDEELRYNSYLGQQIGDLEVILFVGFKERRRNDLSCGKVQKDLKIIFVNVSVEKL